MARSRGCRLADTADDVPGAILTVVGDRWDDKTDFEVRQPEWFRRDRFKVREEAEFLSRKKYSR
ncbi:MAG: hypothetical protein ABH969_05735 [Pseudomonadota bacterium]